MGAPSMPWYGDADLGSAIESAEKIIAKIKSNKFDKEDLYQLDEALSEIKKAVKYDEN
jgi:hypothetical protein